MARDVVVPEIGTVHVERRLPEILVERGTRAALHEPAGLGDLHLARLVVEPPHVVGVFAKVALSHVHVHTLGAGVVVVAHWATVKAGSVGLVAGNELQPSDPRCASVH